MAFRDRVYNGLAEISTHSFIPIAEASAPFVILPEVPSALPLRKPPVLIPSSLTHCNGTISKVCVRPGPPPGSVPPRSTWNLGPRRTCSVFPSRANLTRIYTRKKTHQIPQRPSTADSRPCWPPLRGRSSCPGWLGSGRR